MCGIVGYYSKAAPVDLDTIDRALAAVAHRGPDDRQSWIDAGGQVGLAHARLSIVDVEGGRQPLHGEDGSIHAVVNGEFYGFESIRADLAARRHRFATRSDSEIVVHLYEEYGDDCVRYLRGEFSVILWDARARRLIAIRDRFGIKPLFYCDTAGSLILASEIKGIFAAGHPARWDYESVHQALFLFGAQDRTLFRDIRQVPPGAMLVADNTGVRVRRYWDLDYPRGGGAPIAESTAIEDVRQLVTEAVRIRLRADVPVSAFLSGGLDSSAVFGFAAGQAANLRAFTVAFDEDAYDETAVARVTAAHHHAHLDVVRASSDEMAGLFVEAVRAAETFGVNWHGVARYQLCRAIRATGFKVALAGEGGDELFAGYHQLRQDAAGEGTGGAATNPELEEVRARLGYAPCWMRHVAEGRRVGRVALAEDFLERFSERNAYTELVTGMDAEQLAGRDRLHQSSYLWIRSVLANYILFAERLEMAHAVETRLPLLDHVLFEYTRNLTSEVMLQGASEKFVLRQAARPVLTEQVYRRTKHPFFAPPASNDGAQPQYLLLRDILTRESLEALPFVDTDAVDALLRALPQLPEHRRIAIDSMLLMLACASVLQREYRVND